MAKAKAKTNQKPDGRGGKRAGAGRKPGYSPKKLPLSVAQVEEMLEKAKAYAKKYGKTIDEILLEFIYGVTEIPIVDEGQEVLEILTRKVGTRDRIACIKLWKEYTSKLAEGGEGDQELGPAVFLPDRHPRLEVIDGGKSSDTE